MGQVVYMCCHHDIAAGYAVIFLLTRCWSLPHTSMDMASELFVVSKVNYSLRVEIQETQSTQDAHGSHDPNPG